MTKIKLGIIGAGLMAKQPSFKISIKIKINNGLAEARQNLEKKQQKI